MNTLDQVLLLEQKVESAVEKIRQLQAENDALRNECSELKNALAVKSEQLMTFETDQDKIESGIQKALDHLNQIEHSVLKTVGQEITTTLKKAENKEPKIEQTAEPVKDTAKNDIPVISMFNSEQPSSVENEAPNFDTMENLDEQKTEDGENDGDSEDLGFDIF
ncbi:MAG: cell division protein ZapB [Treponema sp.]|nr:cell division protein ZapB [Treponema sp.]